MSESALYLYSPYCLLRPTTNRIFDVRMADAFSGQNMYSEIIYPYTYMKDNISRSQIVPFYGIKHTVVTQMQPTPLLENSGRLWRTMVLMISFFLTTLRIFFKELFKKRKSFIASRDLNIIFPAIVVKKFTFGLFRTKMIYMAPEVKSGKIFKYVIKNADGIIAGTSLSRDRIRAVVPVSEDKFALALAPVPEYKNDLSKSAARNAISYTDSKPLIVYTGKLGMDVQEVIYILQTAKLLPQYNFLFTGGRASTINEVKSYCKSNGIENVLLTGFITDSTAIRNYQLAADVLVSYYTSKDHMVEFNYPQKINEYLSTGNPVVTPDFPATKDVLNSGNVLFVAPDSPAALAEGIKKLVDNPALSNQLAAAAKKTIQPLVFPERAKIWKNFFENLS